MMVPCWIQIQPGDFYVMFWSLQIPFSHLYIGHLSPVISSSAFIIVWHGILLSTVTVVMFQMNQDFHEVLRVRGPALRRMLTFICYILSWKFGISIAIIKYLNVL